MTEKDKRKLDFSAIIASTVHDMKNSLGMLLGSLDDITSQITPDTFPAYQDLMRLRFEGKRLNSNLIQLLALYRIDNSQYALNITDNDVEECLEECYLENEGLLSLKNIKMEYECNDNIIWFFDRTLISGVINTVINNSLKYTKNLILLSAQVENDYLVIHVDDNGEGYPENMLQQNIDSQREISFKSGSTGLGLYFSSLVAEMHTKKGRCGYTSISNDGIDGGARFSIHLP